MAEAEGHAPSPLAKGMSCGDEGGQQVVYEDRGRNKKYYAPPEGAAVRGAGHALV
jgi:hypothetical protein